MTMDHEQFKKHQAFAGEKKPSMLRRRIGHDYQSRRMYLVTITVEGRKPLLGRLVGDADAPEGSSEEPRVVLSPLGELVRERWMATEAIYPQIQVVGLQIMPDHLHGILFVKERMDMHLGAVVKGFKAGCNKVFREMEAATRSQHSERGAQQQNRRGGSVGYAETVSQPKLAVSQPKLAAPQPKRGLLWALGYNDHILDSEGELERWKNYLKDNPRRLAIRRSHPEFFRVQFGITIAGHTYAAIGNRFLLHHPLKKQVQLTRKLTDAEIESEVRKGLSLARDGYIPVSPAISDGESAVMRSVLNAHLPLIFLTPWGFNTFSKPGHQYYEACAEGRFLILAPWPHQNERIALTRQMCLALNKMAKEIAEY